MRRFFYTATIDTLVKARSDFSSGPQCTTPTGQYLGQLRRSVDHHSCPLVYLVFVPAFFAGFGQLWKARSDFSSGPSVLRQPVKYLGQLRRSVDHHIMPARYLVFVPAFCGLRTAPHRLHLDIPLHEYAPSLGCARGLGQRNRSHEAFDGIRREQRASQARSFSLTPNIWPAVAASQ